MREVVQTFRKTGTDEEGVTYTLYPNAHDLRKAFPSMKFGDGYHGVMDLTAGVLRADKALLATRV